MSDEMILALYNPEWAAEFAIRDALRTHDHLRQEYERRKLDFAERSGRDRKVYAQIKEIECREFVESVLAAN